MRRHRIFRNLRKLHLIVGLVSALYFMLIAATGVAINHRQGWRLEECSVARTWLPKSYRPNDGAAVRADIVVTDLHSGLIFGKVGAPMMDVVATVWLFSIVSGISMLALRKSIHGSARKAKRPPSAASQPPVVRAREKETELAGSRR